MDIIVTTPKDECENAEKEAADCIKNGGGFYFRTFKKVPCGIVVGEKVFYVEDKFIRGFCTVDHIVDLKGRTCESSGRYFKEGLYLFMRADSWKWIRPIAMDGFRGPRKAGDLQYEVIGDWLQPYPGRNPPYSCPSLEANKAIVCMHPYCTCQWLFHESATTNKRTNC